MAKIQLHRSFDLTAPTSFTNYRFGPNESWMDFDGGYRLTMTSNYDDTLRDLYLTQNGSQVFSMSNFNISIAPSHFDEHEVLVLGNWLSIWNSILARNDDVTGSAGRDIVDGLTGNDIIRGLGGNDILRGGAGSDSLIGGTGNDAMDGGAGNDRLVAGQGADIVRGGLGVDTLEFQTSARVTVDLTLAKAQAFQGSSVTVAGVENLRGGAGHDRLLGNAQANVLDGGTGNDVLMGRSGNDVLRSGAGNDRLDGGLGNDVLAGGMGADRFIFRPGSGQDKISDFAQVQDRIVFDAGPDDISDLSILDRGADTVIRYGANSITLANVDHRLIDEADFVFA